MNPLRRDWDSSWREHIEEPKFVEQVSWELNALEKADIVVFNFPTGYLPDGRPKEAPVTLLELGFVAGMVGRGMKVVICCSEGYTKRGNVQILGQKMGATVVDEFEKLIFQTLSAFKELDTR